MTCWLIERVTGRDIIEAIDRWKQLRRDGWDITALQERSTGDVVGFGYRPQQLTIWAQP